MSTDLHKQVDALGMTDWRIRALLHSLVDLRVITEVECMDPACRYSGERFNQGRYPLKVSIDHVDRRANGGTDLPGNLRIVHLGCNAARNGAGDRAAPGPQSTAIKAKKSAAMKRWWASRNNEERAAWGGRVSAGLCASDKARAAWESKPRDSSGRFARG